MRRALLLRLADQQWVTDRLLTSPAAAQAVGRYVPGERLDDALAAVRDLQFKGLWAAVDRLAAEATTLGEARDNAAAQREVIQRLADEQVTAGCEIPLKLTTVGLGIGSEGPTIATELAAEICQAAHEAGTRVTIDMQEHTSTDQVLETMRRLRADFPETGVALQASLRRTESDCRELAYEGSRVRLCKGAYAMPDAVAYQTRRGVDRSYVRCLRLLMESPAYPMVATHDHRIIEIAGALAATLHRGSDTFEYQMYYGIRPMEQRRLVDIGQHVRVSVPFGAHWSRYYLRRLASRPANLASVLWSLSRR